MFSLQMMEMSERLKGLKKLRNGILLPDAEAAKGIKNNSVR